MPTVPYSPQVCICNRSRQQVHKLLVSASATNWAVRYLNINSSLRSAFTSIVFHHESEINGTTDFLRDWGKMKGYSSLARKHFLNSQKNNSQKKRFLVCALAHQSGLCKERVNCYIRLTIQRASTKMFGFPALLIFSSGTGHFGLYKYCRWTGMGNELSCDGTLCKYSQAAIWFQINCIAAANHFLVRWTKIVLVALR